MRFVKHFHRAILCILLICGFAESAQGKSVYVISKHVKSTVQVYDILGSEIGPQFTDRNFPHNGLGVVGLAVADSGVLFASYDNVKKIELVNAQTMVSEENPVTSPAEIAGIVFWETEQRLLAVHREWHDLYIYIYDHDTKTLSLDDTVVLSHLHYPYAYGICLDERDDRLYVTDDTSEVKCYDVQYNEENDPNFIYAGDIDTTKKAIGIAVYNNGQGTKYLYTGGYSHTPGNHNFLIRTDLNNPEGSGSRILVDVGATVLGLAVDEDTGGKGWNIAFGGANLRVPPLAGARSG